MAGAAFILFVIFGLIMFGGWQSAESAGEAWQWQQSAYDAGVLIAIIVLVWLGVRALRKRPR